MESEKITSKDEKTGTCESDSYQGGLMRQTSMSKTNCLCSPTTHAGSFRCRLHRTPTLHRTKSIESVSLPHAKDLIH